MSFLDNDFKIKIAYFCKDDKLEMQFRISYIFPFATQFLHLENPL